jgi:two-component system, LytTR family, response regulator
VFLDVEMPLINGIELLKHLNPKPAVIMITAYTDFAFEAYQHEAVDYIQKPVSLIRFQTAVERAKKYLKANAAEKRVAKEWIIKTDEGNLHIESTQLIYIEALGNYIKLYFNNKPEVLVVYQSLQNALDKLDKDIFVRVHRSYAVNRQYLQSILPHSLLLKNKQQIPVGRKYRILLEK